MIRSCTLWSAASHAALVAAVAGQPCGTPLSQWPGTGGPNTDYYGAAYDSFRARTVVYGGAMNAGGYSSNTWEFDSSGPGVWLLRATSGPPALANPCVVYDSVRHRTVLFGGNNNPLVSTQTWEWDGNTWTQVQTAVSPPHMDRAPIAFDSVRQRVVLVSNIYTSPGTWEYDGVNWVQIPGEAPNAAIYDSVAPMAFDPVRARMVILVVDPLPGDISGQTWERTGTTWARTAAVSASPRVLGHAGVFDSGLQSVIVLGYGRVWRWRPDLDQWHLLDSASYSSPRDAAVYDTATGRTIVPSDLIYHPNQTFLYNTGARPGPVLSDCGPIQVAATTGQPVQLRVASLGPASFQWRRNNVPLSDGGVYSGTHTDQLTISQFSIPLTGWFDCVVTDACGSTIRPTTFVDVGCYANCDGTTTSPILNVNDFACFMNVFAAGCPEPFPQTCYINCDHSTTFPVLSANDFQCFLNKYAAGCT